MPRYWVIAPIESDPPERFDKVWQFDLASNLISIGWEELGDVSTMCRDELAEALATTYPDQRPNIRSLWANMILSFYHDVRPGDLIIARRGLKALVGVGRVTRSAFYAPEKSPVHHHPNFLEVAWDKQQRAKVFPTLVFQRRTLSELTDKQFQNLVEGSELLPESTALNEGIEDPNEFVLEKYLEEFIVSNFKAIFQGQLKIYRNTEKDEGQQYDTNEIGRIDILATEPATNSFIVIELKKGRPSDQVIGQTLRYMGWVKQNLCTNGQTVRGLVICREPDPRLSYALEVTNDIDVRYYNVSFELRESP